MHSALFTGWIRHRRHEPTRNNFRYRLFMMYLDLAELPTLFDRFWLWSARRSAPASWRRRDHHGAPSTDLATAIRDLVESHGHPRPRGPIRLLTHLRYFGRGFNPVSFYYCFDERDVHVETIVAEINNTPWGEQHCYVLAPANSVAEPDGSAVGFRERRTAIRPRTLRFTLRKDFHVSPFMPMDIHYDWRFTEPGGHLFVHMENWREGRHVFDATLTLKRRPITSATLLWALVSYPLLTVRLVALIYWQALRLWLKRTPFHPHPASSRPLGEPTTRASSS